jgi:hypothetical protein
MRGRNGRWRIRGEVKDGGRNERWRIRGEVKDEREEWKVEDKGRG